ncbi:MAG: hypothetical protein A4E19_09615 [Nitrospira sp. SG-bin1]|nr:MAG: hypothetical protein A4E19_09615 [Nitrospira sp. SG-bin1]
MVCDHGEQTRVVTNITPDTQGRERYWISVEASQDDPSRLKDIVDAIVYIETYYHLLLMQNSLFSAAIDQAYKFEQVHLKQREIITSHIMRADSEDLQRWLNTHARPAEDQSNGGEASLRAVGIIAVRQDRACHISVDCRTTDGLLSTHL